MGGNSLCDSRFDFKWATWKFFAMFSTPKRKEFFGFQEHARLPDICL
jgi:hypothetical protein